MPTLGFIVARAEAFVMLIGIIEGSSYTASSETHSTGMRDPSLVPRVRVCFRNNSQVIHIILGINDRDAKCNQYHSVLSLVFLYSIFPLITL